MSGKNIEVRIAATGGDQAAAEIKKVGTATAGLDPAAGAAGSGVEDLTEKIEALKKEAAELGEEEISLAKQKLSLGNAARSSTASIRAKQRAVTGLTAALRATTRGSALVGAGLRALLNPYAAIGTVIGIATGALAKWIQKNKEAKIEAEKAIAAQVAKLDELKQKASDLAAERAGLATREWLETLDAEDAAIELQNKSIQRQIHLIRALREAQAGIDTAERDAEISEIQTDPSKDDATKIREVSAVREREERARVQQQLDNLAAESNTALIDLNTAAQALAAEQASVLEAEERLAALEEERATLAQRGRTSRGGKSAREELEKQLEIENQIKPSSVGSGFEGFDAEAFEAAKARRAQIEAQIEEAKRAENQFTEADRTRLDALNGDEGVAKNRGIVQDRKKQAEAASQTAADAAGAALSAREKQEQLSPKIAREFEIRSGTRGQQAEAAARAAEERDRSTKQRERERAEAEDQRKAETAAARRLSEEKGIGREARSIIPKTASDSLRNAVEAAAQGLQDGDQGGEIEALASIINRLAEAAARSKNATEAQRIKIAQLEERIRNL